ncbi:MAG: hypothetical protein F6K28_51765 [Microcoleus sp. SIO2G3]|nr:hypothetical protein [Microcoleus sp. SIO2G3]
MSKSSEPRQPNRTSSCASPHLTRFAELEGSYLDRNCSSASHKSPLPPGNLR